MATQREIDYALMAGAAYRSTRSDINRFPVPQGWSEIPSSHVVLPSGFEAISFTNGSEIVISFAGTGPGLNADWLANSGLALGLGSTQLLQAAEYYLQVKAANPGADITFTGHSLGGGLASLLGVFFNETAVTFDQAPFRNSANVLVANDLLLRLKDAFPAAGYPQIATWLAPLERFAQDGLTAREVNVTDINVQGEVLDYLPFSGIGSQTSLSHGTPDLSLAVDLHSQALLTAFLQSDRTAAPGQALDDVTFKLTDLLAMIFDEGLYARTTSKTNTTDPNLLDRLIRHEFGNAPGATDTDMLTRFTADMWKIAQDGGLTLTDNNISKALIAFAMQMYYEKTTAADKYLFTEVTGGIRFDRNDVAATLTAAKGYQYFKDYLETLPGAERELIARQLPGLLDWYIQAGGQAMMAAAGDQRALMLGGVGDDSLTGGGLADVLARNAANDSFHEYSFERNVA
ncbi:MAG: lipase family protein [Pseudomonadota bacterium]